MVMKVNTHNGCCIIINSTKHFYSFKEATAFSQSVGLEQLLTSSSTYSLLNWFRLLSTYPLGVKKAVKNTTRAMATSWKRR